ncbi:MAG: hypothetical protein ACFFD2_00695 [Promethearchaeota archaeon]
MKKRKLILFTTLIFLILLLISPPNYATYDYPKIYYDDEFMETYYTPLVGEIVTVRFTPPMDTFKLSGMRVYLNGSNKEKVRIWIWDSTRTNIIMEPYNESFEFISGPYYSIDFPEGPIFTADNVSDFYIVLQWLFPDAPNIGIDTSSNTGRSWYNATGTLQQYTSNIMIQAKISDINPPQFDHIPMKFAIAGAPLTISMEVEDEFGVQSVTLYYRENGSINPYGAISLSLSGDPKNGYWYGTIPGINVTLNGLEYYLWATDIGSNTRYFGNATIPYVVTVFGKIFKIPLIVNIILIATISAAAVVLVFILPKYKGEDIK